MNRALHRCGGCDGCLQYGYPDQKKVLNGMGFPADTWTKAAGVLSGGEQTRLRLARLLLERPDLLILDEPTNHLDLETMEWLENYLKAYRGAVLVVSHDRYFLDAVCTRIWELRGKSIKTYRGNYLSLSAPARGLPMSASKSCTMPPWRKAAKLQDYVDRNLVRASTTKWRRAAAGSEKAGDRGGTHRRGVELNFRFEYDIEPYDELVIMKNLSVHIGERTLIDALDYVVHRGDKHHCRPQRRWQVNAFAGAGRQAPPPLRRHGAAGQRRQASIFTSSRRAAQAASWMPSGTSTPALRNWRCAAIWRGSATAARRVQGLCLPLRRRAGPPALCRAGA